MSNDFYSKLAILKGYGDKTALCQQVPEDNSWIESWFGILRYDGLMLKDYVSFGHIEEIIK